MTKIIKDYTSWLNESVSEAESTSTTTPSAETQGGVTFISATSSASNVAPALAQKMGVEPNKLYTIQLNRIGQLNTIYLDGKFGGDKAKAAGVIMDPAAAIATKAGEDILEINGKRIVETGAIIFTKAELAGQPLTIKASGNGLLTLLRMGEAISVMWGTHKNVLGYSKEWAIRFAIGGNVQEKDSRGFSYWFAKPGDLEGDSNAIALVTALAVLKASGNENRIAVTDFAVSNWYTSMIKGKDPKASINAVAKYMSTTLAKKMMLVQNPVADLSGAWTINDYKPLLKIQNEVMKIRITEAGKAALAPIVTAVANAIAPTTPPPGFGAESQGVLKAYADMIKTGLGAKANQVGYWLETSQIESNWSPEKSQPGTTGTATAQQGEGQFGPKKN